MEHLQHGSVNARHTLVIHLYECGRTSYDLLADLRFALRCLEIWADTKHLLLGRSVIREVGVMVMRVHTESVLVECQCQM